LYVAIVELLEKETSEFIPRAEIIIFVRYGVLGGGVGFHPIHPPIPADVLSLF